MTGHNAIRRRLWQNGDQALADRIKDTSTGFPYAVTFTDHYGVLNDCPHRHNHTCRRMAWKCAEKLVRRSPAFRAFINSVPRKTR